MKKFLLLLSFVCASMAQAQEFEGLKPINGTRLYISVKGEGETLVLLHGGPGLNHSYFKPHLAPLEKNFRLVYYDQRASGKSDTPSPDSINIQLMVQDLEMIRAELKLDKLNILGHSWGAVLATHYAIAYPDKVNKLIYSNPAMLSREYDQEAALLTQKRTTKEDSTKRSTLMSTGPLSVSQYSDLFLLLFRASAYNPENLRKLDLNLPPNFSTANNALFTGLMKDPQKFQANLYDSLKTFNFPVLIIHGEADALPPSSIERLRKSLPQARLVVMKSSGHFPFVEENEAYNAAIESFLR